MDYKSVQLSGWQRVAIIRALANDPAFVLADDPTGNLDSVGGWEVFDLMRKLHRTTGKVFWMVTHDRTFAREADCVLLLKDGRFVEE